MKRTTFRLDPVLRVRKRELDRARGSLAEAIQDSARWRREQARWTDEALAESRSISARLGEGMNAGLLRATSASVDAARQRAAEASQQLQTSEQKVAGALEDVVAAKTRVRALEILRERRQREQRVLEEHQAQLRLDEVGARIALQQQTGDA